MMTAIAAWVGVLISLGSLIVATVALLKSSRTQSLLAEIEQSRRQEEQHARNSANLIPELLKSGRAHRLIVRNTGCCEARNVTASINGKPCCDYGACVLDKEIPAIIGAGSKVGMMMAFHLGCEPPFELELYWDDDSGAEKHNRTTITF